MISISGIRGVVGESLTPGTVVKYAQAFAEYCKHKPIVIGRDGRITGKIVGNIVSSTLLAAGCDVIAVGVAPTPTIALAVEKLNAAGGISITASHNPAQWNGLKFISHTGMFLNAAENKRLWAIAERANAEFAPWDKLGKHASEESFLKRHYETVFALPQIHLEEIRRRRFKVVVDCINAAGGMIVPPMLQEMGCDVIEMNCDVSGIFARPPEPVPENLTAVCDRVRKEKADLGIVVDPDVDRLVLITEKGEPLGEEYTIASAVDFVLSHEQKTTSSSVVINLSTTRAVEDIAKKYHAKVYRTPVGEINVAQKMKKVGAVIGGEGSGGVILPAVHYGRDAMVGIGLLLQQVTEFGGTLSEFKCSLPQYTITKSKIGIGRGNPDKKLEAVKKRYRSAGKINTDDGLKIDFPNSWVHLRKSNTEPIIRIIAEAPTADEAEALVSQFQKALSEKS